MHCEVLLTSFFVCSVMKAETVHAAVIIDFFHALDFNQGSTAKNQVLSKLSSSARR